MKTYVTLTALEVVLVSVSLGLPLPLAAILLIPVTTALVHVNDAPPVELVGL